MHRRNNGENMIKSLSWTIAWRLHCVPSPAARCALDNRRFAFELVPFVASGRPFPSSARTIGAQCRWVCFSEWKSHLRATQWRRASFSVRFVVRLLRSTLSSTWKTSVVAWARFSWARRRRSDYWWPHWAWQLTCCSSAWSAWIWRCSARIETVSIIHWRKWRGERLPSLRLALNQLQSCTCSRLRLGCPFSRAVLSPIWSEEEIGQKNPAAWRTRNELTDSSRRRIFSGSHSREPSRPTSYWIPLLTRSWWLCSFWARPASVACSIGGQQAPSASARSHPAARYWQARSRRPSKPGRPPWRSSGSCGSVVCPRRRASICGRSAMRNWRSCCPRRRPAALRFHVSSESEELANHRSLNKG